MKHKDYRQKTTEEGAVDVQHPNDFTACADGHHNLGIGRAVTGDVAGELVDVLNQLGFALRHGGSAHPPVHRDLNAGRLALEGAKHQRVPLQQMEPRPVETVQ